MLYILYIYILIIRKITMGNYNITIYDLMYRFKRVKRFNRYTIYYDNKNMNYFRNNHI